jgi:Aminotransferase class I and II.
VKLSKRFDAVPDNIFTFLDGQAMKKREAGLRVIDLGKGSPDLTPPGHIIQKMIDELKRNEVHTYPPFLAIPSLKRAVIDYYWLNHGVSLEEDEVALVPGTKTGIHMVSQAILDAGDAALVPDPGYPDYISGIRLAGGIDVPYPLDKDYLPDLGKIKYEISKNARLIFVNYPSNPTSAVADIEVFKEIKGFAQRRGLVVVSDIAYGPITFDNKRSPSFLEVDGAKDIGVELFSLSKIYSMAGWRVGFVVGNRELVKAVESLTVQYFAGVFLPVQEAAVSALKSPYEEIQKVVSIYQDRKEVFTGVLKSHGVEFFNPGGTIYVWYKIPDDASSMTYAAELLDSKGVIVAPGIGFGRGGEGYARVSLTKDVGILEEAAGLIGSFQEEKTRRGRL